MHVLILLFCYADSEGEPLLQPEDLSALPYPPNGDEGGWVDEAAGGQQELAAQCSSMNQQRAGHALQLLLPGRQQLQTSAPPKQRSLPNNMRRRGPTPCSPRLLRCR